MAGNKYGIRLGLGHTCGNGTNTRTSYQLDGHAGIRVDLLKVVNELRQILDGINIVVRRWGDQRDPRRCMAQLGNKLGHLEAGQLPTFARFGPLRNLNFQLAAIVQVLRGHPKTPRCHLLDGGGCIIPIRAWFGACRVLAPFPGIGFGTNPVHGDGEGLVRFGAQSAK